MILLILAQGEHEIPLAVFDSIDEGRAFLRDVPGYSLEEGIFEDCPYSYEIINPDELPDYIEISYKGNQLPLTRFMFSSSEEVDLFWHEIPYLDRPDQGLVDGGTRVDAYILENTEAKEYIERREEGYQRVKEILQAKGYTVWRDFRGSEDGEAILYQKEGEEGHILLYLDPDFLGVAELNDEDLNKWILAELNQWKK